VGRGREKEGKRKGEKKKRKTSVFGLSFPAPSTRKCGFFLEFLLSVCGEHF
jgi:hypothetical protein